MKPYGREKKIKGGFAWKLDVHPKKGDINWWEDMCANFTRSRMKQLANKEIQTEIEMAEMEKKIPMISLKINGHKRTVKDILFYDNDNFVGSYKNHKIYIAKHEPSKTFQVEVVNSKGEEIVSGWHEEHLGKYLKTSLDCLEMAVDEILLSLA
jgi:hypothetical protein